MKPEDFQIYEKFEGAIAGLLLHAHQAEKLPQRTNLEKKLRATQRLIHDQLNFTWNLDIMNQLLSIYNIPWEITFSGSGWNSTHH